MSSFLSLLRARLVLIALAALLPAIVAVVWMQSIERRAARERTLANNLRLARLAASDQAGVFEGARRLLLALAEFPQFRESDPRPCEQLLTNILRVHTGYFNVALADAEGSLLCAAVPVDPRLRIGAGGRSWFERAKQTRTTVVGDYQISATTGKPAIVIAHPLLDSSGRVFRMLAAAIGLDHFNRIASQAELPRGATLTLFSRTRTILARFPDGPSWVGRSMPASWPIERLVASDAAADIGETAGVDGVPRLFVTVPVRASIDTGLFLSMGIEHDAAFQEADRVFRQYLWLLAIVSITAIGAAIAAGQLFVLRPVKALKVVTDRLAAGDLDARAQLATGIAGVSELGDAVNAMAAAVDARQRERDRAELELRQSEDRYRLLFERHPRPMWVYDRDTLRFLEINDAAIRHYGYSRDEFLAMRITDIQPPEDIPRLSATLAAGEESWEQTEGWRHRLKSGDIIDVEVRSHTLMLGGRPAALVTAQDVTARVRAEEALADRTAVSGLAADVAVALNRPHDLHRCLETCAKAVVAHLDAAAVAIWIFNAADDCLELAASAGLYRGADDTPRRIPVGQLIVGGIARDRRRYFTNHAIEDATVQEQAWVRRERMVAFAGCPLLVESRVVGVMALYARHPLSEPVFTGVASVAELMALGITRRQAEEARRFLASIVASSDDAIFGTAVDGTIVSWNAGAERLYGYSAEEVIGQPVWMLCPPDRIEEIVELRGIASRGEHVINRETVRRRKDGSSVPVSITLSPIKNTAGETTGISATVRDISARQQAERTLRQSEERFRLIAETITQVFWIADVEIRSMLYVSPAYESIWGRSCDSLYQDPRSFLEAIHADDRDRVVEDLRIQQTGQPFDHEYRIVRPEGEVRWIRDRGFPVPTERGHVVQYVGVAEDITEQRSLEQQLRQSQKMDAIGQLAGGVAHDFNNLLTAIQGFAGFLLESLPESDERRADVEEIRQAGERAAALTRQLLAFSRKQILMVRVLHVGDVVDELTPMLRRLLGEAVDLRTTIGDRGLVKADPGQLQQVLVNLAVNAHDAMREAGRLTIETADVVLDEAFARQHPSVRPGPHVMLAVSDTGHGMDAATQKRIFEPFFTTKPMGQGTGLGLATVYGIVKQSEGSIWVESEIGRGTTFKVYLPSTDEAEKSTPRAAVDTEKVRGTETILLVEDEDRVRDLAHRILTRRGYIVHAIADPKSAIEYATAHRAPIDLVVTDVVLPEMSGRTMFARIAQGHPESKVLYMSGFAGDAIVRQGVLEAGMWFLQKPFTADQLAGKVRETLDASPPADADAPAKSSATDD